MLSCKCGISCSLQTCLKTALNQHRTELYGKEPNSLSDFSFKLLVRKTCCGRAGGKNLGYFSPVKTGENFQKRSSHLMNTVFYQKFPNVTMVWLWAPPFILIVVLGKWSSILLLPHFYKGVKYLATSTAKSLRSDVQVLMRVRRCIPTAGEAFTTV